MFRFSRRGFLALVSAFGVSSAFAAKDDPISDDLLFDLVNQRIVADPDLGTRPLRIAVENGKVTVTGYVETEKLRKKVDKVVGKVKGVREVVNKVEIRQ